jgi:hypothetical protein
MKGSGAGAGSVQIITDPDLGCPKTYGSGSGTLVSYLELLAKETITAWKGYNSMLRINEKIF